jgi:hypothetical protein
MLNVHWFKCGNAPNNNWCPLETLKLETVTESGVYIIWHEGNPGRIVYVGQGDPISARFSAHRGDRRILAYQAHGTLRVTWATVPASQRDGVECYLAAQWKPLVGDVHPDALQIEVNSPFG